MLLHAPIEGRPGQTEIAGGVADVEMMPTQRLLDQPPFGSREIQIAPGRGERIARVVIESGNAALSATNNDEVNGTDIVAMDDFIYGEPRAAGHHSSDFDGDGTSDYAVFRPSIGTWFVLNSGSNVLSQTQFGEKGDVPVDGDFDGDSRTDIAVFRPSIGSWFALRSSNNQL